MIVRGGHLRLRARVPTIVTVNMDALMPRFSVSRYRFTLEAQEPILAPALNKGNMLRGAFGSAFKRIACSSVKLPRRVHTTPARVPDQDCHGCDTRSDCPYAAVFETAPPPGAERLRLNADIPRPFVIKPPLDTTARYDTGALLVFDVVLIGRAARYLPYFLLAFEEIGATGLGLRDERRRRGRCRLASVDAILAGQLPVRMYDGANRTVRNVEAVVTAAQLSARLRAGEADLSHEPGLAGAAAAPSPVSSVKIDFLTPTALKCDGRFVDRPAFGHLIRRLRDRVNALGTFYGDGPMEVDFRGLGDRADKVRTLDCNVKWEDRTRFSSRRQIEHELSGFAGTAVYEGDLDEFVPLLAISDWVHVGKHATFGHGWTETRVERHRWQG